MSLRESLDKLDSEELYEKLLHQMLTEEASEIARGILLSRGVTPPVANEWEPAQIEKTPIHIRLAQLIKDCVRGEAPLGTAYWSLGLVLFAIAVIALLGYEFTRLTVLDGVFSYLFMALILLGNPFHAYCVWKCSKNTNNAFFGHIAKMYAGLQLLVWCVLIPFAMIGSLFQ